MFVLLSIQKKFHIILKINKLVVHLVEGNSPIYDKI